MSNISIYHVNPDIIHGSTLTNFELQLSCIPYVMNSMLIGGPSNTYSLCSMHTWLHVLSIPCVPGYSYVGFHACRVLYVMNSCVSGSSYVGFHVYQVPCLPGSMLARFHAYQVPCLPGSMLTRFTQGSTHTGLHLLPALVHRSLVCRVPSMPGSICSQFLC